MATPLPCISASNLGWNQLTGRAFVPRDPRLLGFIRLKGRKMSERATKFFEIWLAENIDRNTHPEEDDSGIPVLAAKIITDAQAASITVGEIEEDAGPIEDCILEAIEDAADVGPFHA